MRNCGCCNESDFDDLKQPKRRCAILLECGDYILTECNYKILKEND
jgi:hypothetical protein